MTKTSLCRADYAFSRGFRDGMRSVVVGGSKPPHVILRRYVGSPATDRIVRHRDMEIFGEDVRRRCRDVIGA